MSKNSAQRKIVRMVRCPNCGAEYEAGRLHCPYCRSVDDYQDESEYLEDLDELRDKLEEMPENVIREHTRLQRREAARDLRKILFIVGAIAAVILLLAGVSAFMAGKSDAKRQDSRKEEYLWKQENFPKLDELYEKKDYEGLREFARNADNIGIYDWKHYPLLDGLSILESAAYGIRSLERLEQENRTDSDLYRMDLTSLLRDELELLYFGCRKAEPEDIEIIEGMSAEYLADLETRFALTPEEREAFEKKAKQDMGEFYLSECEEFLKDR